MPPADMTNEELTLAVAERCGGVEAHEHDWYWTWKDGRPPHYRGPKFAESMDACLAPGGPVEWLRERGLTLITYSWPSHGHTVQVLNEQMLRREAAFIEGEKSLPRALCLAFLAATGGDHD